VLPSKLILPKKVLNKLNNKYKKKTIVHCVQCSAFLAVREMQTEPKIRCHFHP
jgi:predicted  nucleic acid-binding Zn-ribbon protein